MKKYNIDIYLTFNKCDKYTQVYLGKALAFIYNPTRDDNNKEKISVTSFIGDLGISQIAMCDNEDDAKSICIKNADIYIKQLSS